MSGLGRPSRAQLAQYVRTLLTQQGVRLPTTNLGRFGEWAQAALPPAQYATLQPLYGALEMTDDKNILSEAQRQAQLMNLQAELDEARKGHPPARVPVGTFFSIDETPDAECSEVLDWTELPAGLGWVTKHQDDVGILVVNQEKASVITLRVRIGGGIGAVASLEMETLRRVTDPHDFDELCIDKAAQLRETVSSAVTKIQN